MRAATPGGRPRPLTALAATTLVAVAALASGGLPFSARAAGGAGETPLESSPATPLTRVPPEHRGFVVLRSIAESPQFADTYAGDVENEHGGTTIYATRPGMAGLAHALERELGPPAADTYELRPATMSYKALDALTQRIAKAAPALAEDGVKLMMWGPDPASNKVRAEIADYTPARAEVLTNRFGDDVTVVAAASDEPMHTYALNRFYDTPSFYNGVSIRTWDGAPYRCTHSFVVRGQWSGDKFGLTAGHCGGNNITTNESVMYSMGRVSTNYFYEQQVGGWDLLSFRCSPCSTTGWVWHENSASRDEVGSTHRVAGVCTWCDRVLDNPENVAVDGAVRGEVRYNAVVTRDMCFIFDAYEIDRALYICHLNRVVNDTARTYHFRVCGKGDSGGPVYQRDGSSSDLVYAAGVLVGGDQPGAICIYHDMTRVLRMTNTDLITPVEPTP
ncbi:MAG TPA: hypothetical protein VGW75_12005 [Solirubrobacteraceae bacterium]|jgi:hypothetical protein|nr:hypothetical protein [Solirubrobacteraceae bacterium]